MKTSKTLTAAFAALAMGGAVLATSAPAEAGWRYRYGGYHGGAVAAGVIGGIALGAIAAGAASQAYAQPVYGYPVEVEPACVAVTRRVMTTDGRIVRVREMQC